MRGFDPFNAFGAEVAAGYTSDLRGDEAETVAFLRRQAGDGAALEFAIGTGRIALPLARAGVPVSGIEISLEMVAELRAQPGGDQVAVTMGDMAEARAPGEFRLVYLIYNTIFNLLTQNGQVRCFANAARHLDADGRFVVECLTPGYLYRLRDSQYVDAEQIDVDQVRLDVGRFDPVTQILDESHVTLSAAGVRVAPIVTRYIWPSELDLMARLADLRLIERWGGWQQEPFTADSRRHISVYGR